MNEKPSTARLALKWGVITGLVEILVTTIRYSLGYYAGINASLFVALNFGVLVTGTVLALREYRSLNDGYLTIGEAVGLSGLMFAIMGLLDSAYSQFYLHVIDPDLLTKTLQQTRDFMEAQGLSDDQIDKFDDQMSEALEAQQQKGNSGSTYLLGLIWWVLGGVVLSFILSLFMRRHKTNPFD